MPNRQQSPGLKAEIETLASRVEELIKVMKRLQADNYQLQLQQDQLTAKNPI